jgi:hypothetical protein
MKPDNHLEDSGAESVPPELIHAIARLREGDVAVSPVTEAAILQAGRERMAAIRDKRSTRAFARRLMPLGAAACAALAWLALRPPEAADNNAGPPVTPEEDVASVLLREFSALYPNQVKSIVQDSHGIELSLADQPYASSGKPLALRVCEPRGCREIITFSGQNIEVAGHAVTVRTGNGDRVILDGERFMWSSDLEESPAPGVHIKSRRL